MQKNVKYLRMIGGLFVLGVLFFAFWDDVDKNKDMTSYIIIRS